MTRKILIGIFIIAALFGLAIRALPNRLQNSPPAQSATVANIQKAEPKISSDTQAYYPVIKVVDGDTIAVNINGKNETIRLIGLDAPETVDPRKPASARTKPVSARRRPVQCFGKEANKKAKEILSGKRVRLEMDASQGERDRYGRLLAYVYLENGTLFNQLMISEGYGHEYTFRLPYKYQKEFKEAEKTARENQRGLWAPGACKSLP